MLEKDLKIEIGKGYELIVQEKIEFGSIEQEVSCYAYIDKDGNIRAISGQHKIIEYPHPYGTGVASVPFYKNEFLDIVKKIARAYKWRGFLGIEFMKNKKDNKWNVIEINLRPWLSIDFQASLGFNYIEMLYQDYYGFFPVFEILISLQKYLDFSEFHSPAFSQVNTTGITGIPALPQALIQSKKQLSLARITTTGTCLFILYLHSF